jgi:hypothetical protein
VNRKHIKITRSKAIARGDCVDNRSCQRKNKSSTTWHYAEKFFQLL